MCWASIPGIWHRIATNLTNRRNVLGFNIHQCTSVTKKGIRRRRSALRDVFWKRRGKFVFVMFSENVVESASQI
jgi:hypothetical protein